MDQPEPLEVLRPGPPPPCLQVGGLICRGCPGWAAMCQALGPQGAWRGAVIHCPVSGLTVGSRPVAGFQPAV
jgi:hypothetical protein